MSTYRDGHETYETPGVTEKASDFLIWMLVAVIVVLSIVTTSLMGVG